MRRKRISQDRTLEELWDAVLRGVGGGRAEMGSPGNHFIAPLIGSPYLRAKEKWAEALGEKFLGLSCGLFPVESKGDMNNLTSLSYLYPHPESSW